MQLTNILDKMSVISVTGNAEDKEIKKITIDSRDVTDNSLFVAIRGYKTDGHKFIPDALNNGAKAVILEDDSVPYDLFKHSDSVKITSPNSRKSLAEASDIYFGSPSKKLSMTGVTGTKGKTTTTFYLKHILESAGLKVGLIGTNKNLVGSKEIKAERTTPESHEINELLTDMVEEKCTHCVMEVSSHALVLHRVDYIDFDFGVFTNITSDHMDFHETFENYRDAKKILFDMLKEGASAVCNIDDPNWKELTKDSKANIVTYGKDKDADFVIGNIEYSLEGTTFYITHEGLTYNVNTKLIGEFNAYNSCAAFVVGYLSGIDPNILSQGIENTPQVPGRFEVINSGDKKVIVDYSHTAGSLLEALTALNKLVAGKRKIYTVFGCGGDRDKTKRPEMGRIASEMSSVAVVTSDNPRTEDPHAIIDDVLKGIENDNYEVIENRYEAIKHAVLNSDEDAVVLIAGKGHEEYQEINGVKNHFSDKETALSFLKEIEK